MTVQATVLGSPPRAMPVTEGRGQGVCSSRGRQHHPAAMPATSVSPKWPMAPSGFISYQEPCCDAAGLLRVPKNKHSSCPELRLPASLLHGMQARGQQVDGRWTLQPCDTQLPRDSQAPPRQALHSHFLFWLEVEQTPGGYLGSGDRVLPEKPLPGAGDQGA